MPTFSVLSPSLLASPFKRLWQRIESQPLPEPEDSIPLRVLVQGLVTVGIVAIDVAAADAVDATGASLWAVPVSAVGATWSWWRRQKRNIPVKFCIAIGMLLALAVFFLRLWTERNDTRLTLATLLIHLQVFHSFDLPRRKDLGYSAIIGLILLSVAATLSQTFAFAPLVLLFLALTIPVLVLDYRSRLGLTNRSFHHVRFDLSLKKLSAFLLVILGLGLAIFALLPRFPGYQLRSFPVSTPIQFEGQFDQSVVLNPGYVQEGAEGTGTGGVGGQSRGSGPGEIDDEFYYGFNTQINQNLRGQLTPKVVMRVRSQAPGFWRVLAFDRYTGQGWEISRNKDHQIQTLERPSWTFRFLLPWEVTLNRTREVVQSYTMTANLPNLIPALFNARELYFPTEQVALDIEGGLRSPVPLSEGLTYTVVSEVPYRDRTLLQQAPTDLVPFIADHYLTVPDAVQAQIREKTEAILSRNPKPITVNYEKALYLAQYLKQTYPIQPNLPFLGEGEDLVEAFLFKYEGGYPDHFSTVLTMMLRSIGIPARLVMGFAPGEYNPFTGYYVVKNTDAYAMTEVYFPKYGWFAFDPIPGHPLIPPSIEESKLFGVLQQFWNWVAGWLPSPVSGVFNQIFQWIGMAIGWFTALFRQGWLGIFAGIGVAIGLAFVAWLGWSGWQVWRYRRWLSRLPQMEAVYQQMLGWLAEQGSRKTPVQTPLEYAQVCRTQQPPDRAKVIENISEAYVRWRYGQESQDVEQLQQQLRQMQRGRKQAGSRQRG